MFYHIAGLCPRTDVDMGRCGFAIKLWPSFAAAVAGYKPRPLTQANINAAIASMGAEWLKGCGFDWRVFQPLVELRVTWGAWGPEHITVPGNACGLDLDDGLGKPRGGKILQPHNVDSIQQAHLLLVVFTFFADTLLLDLEMKEYGGK